MKFTPLGTIIDPKEDIFPSSGPHLHVEVLKNNQRVDPEFARSLLQNVTFGKNNTPIVQQSGQDWKWNLERTSRFGPRNTGIKGASTDHRGLDLASAGLTPGTPIAYRGAGTFVPRQGYGALLTTDAQGTPYELRFLHTKPAAATTENTVNPPSSYQDADQRTKDVLEAFMYGTQYKLSPREQTTQPKGLVDQIKDRLTGAVLGEVLSDQAPSSSFLDKYMGNLDMQEAYQQAIFG